MSGPYAHLWETDPPPRKQNPYAAFTEPPTKTATIKDAEQAAVLDTPPPVTAHGASGSWGDPVPAVVPAVVPVAAPRDVTNTRATPNINPHPSHLPEPVASVLKFGVDPMLEHPIATALAANPVGGALATAGMVKDLTQYGAQKAAELTLPDDVRAMAEVDPTRISGKQAAVEGAMLALPVVAHTLHSVVDVSPGMMEAGASGLRELGGTGTKPPIDLAATGAAAIPEGLVRSARTAGTMDARAGSKNNPYRPESPLHAQYEEGFASVPKDDVGAFNALRTPATKEGVKQLRADRVNAAIDKGLERQPATAVPEPPVTVAAPAAPETPEAPPLLPDGIEERNVGLSLSQKTREKIRTAYRSAMVTPYAAAETEAPALVEALHKGGAAAKRAQDVGSYRLDRLFRDLTPEQEQQFGQRLLLDQYEGEAARKGAVDPAIAQRFTDLADNLRQTIPAGIEQQPWFQKTLTLYKSSIEKPMTDAAVQAGVDPADLRPTKLAYMKLASERRLDDAEIRQALDVANTSDPASLQRRPAILRKLIGENPALGRYFANQADAPRQGPLATDAGGAPVGYASPGPRTQTTSSARMAAGTADSYSPDLRRILAVDTREKLLKAANNQVLDQIVSAGRKLGPGELAAPGKRTLAFDQKNIVLLPENSEPIAMSAAQRYEVSPAVQDAVRTYFDQQRPTPKSPARQAVQRVANILTRAQIAGMPVEATSHANTLASIASKVPGEQDAAGSALAAIPGFGGKAAAIREMMGVDFNDPATIALRDRLADIGAMRIEEGPGGLVNTSHKWLFGPEGVDPRARLVLARKYLARDPNASDATLREFITSQTGNYNSANAGVLPNFMAKGSFLSPFARFQAARIPTSIKRTVGVSDLPATSTAQRVGDVANTLYRGPLGYVAAAELANLALTGHSTQKNDAGHALDVNTGLYAVPGGIEHLTPEQAAARGNRAAPLYLPAATLDPVTYAGLRATGLRAAVPWLSPEQPNALRPENAVRDVTNVALGTAGPSARAAQTVLTGTQPYLQPDGTFLRVASRRFGSDLGERIATAFGLANPAVHAFTASSGDASRTLAGAMAQDDRPLGGPASVAAKIAEFLMPRVLAPGVGGKTNEQSADVQLTRRYRDVIADYKSQIKRAPGPNAVQQIIDEAKADGARAGYDPDVIEADLLKAAGADPEQAAEKSQRQTERRIQKIRP